jgi:hypothetical protein
MDLPELPEYALPTYSDAARIATTASPIPAFAIALVHGQSGKSPPYSVREERNCQRHYSSPATYIFSRPELFHRNQHVNQRILFSIS